MDLGLEIKGSKLVLKWQDVKADCYRIFLKNDGNFCECARISGETEIRISLIPYGDGECFVVAVKDGLIIDKSSIRQFKTDTIDVVSRYENENEIKFFYSKYEGAQGYRLYKNEAEQGFGGCKNSDSEFISTEILENTEYKIKPFRKNENGREFLTSSKAFKPDENVFKSLSVYKSFNYNLFLSWNYVGYADGFEVFSENSKIPIFETNDGLRHYLELFDYKGTTKFIVKAFVNTPNGRLTVAQSKPVGLSIRKYEKPQVSIIIPAYNAKDYIARSIDSALASDFSNLEIVIVNDGSTDDTQKIIDWYDKNYENIVSIKKENGGVADARNVGIEAARGEYIAFLDNDDLIRPNMISSLYATITKNNCDVAIAPLYRLTDKGYTLHCNLPFVEDIGIDIDKYLDIMYTPGYYNCAIWNKLYKASMVKAHPLGKLKYEDVSWTPCILSYAEKFCFIKTPLYEWDRKTRPETFGDVLAKQPEDELFEHRKQAMLFFVQNGNPKKREYLKRIAIRRLERYSKNSDNRSYKDLMEKINDGKY
jgi:glycosyltransferase involved in cell wall biosynthesis